MQVSSQLSLHSIGHWHNNYFIYFCFHFFSMTASCCICSSRVTVSYDATSQLSSQSLANALSQFFINSGLHSIFSQPRQFSFSISLLPFRTHRSCVQCHDHRDNRPHRPDLTRTSNSTHAWTIHTACHIQSCNGWYGNGWWNGNGN